MQNPILTQIKASLQVSYDLYQAKMVTYNFISKRLATEATSIGYYITQVFVDINTRGDKVSESGVKGTGGAIFTGFYPIWSTLSDREKKSFFGKWEHLNIKVGWKHKLSDKNKYIRSASIKSKKKASQKIQRDISSLIAKCK